jgi:ribosomal protein S12 methylthiotransferase accessory factor YcaO
MCFTNGKGATKESALASALGEYIERLNNRARVAGATDLILSAHADAIKRLSQ